MIGTHAASTASQVAGEAAGEYPDGIWWLDLTALADGALVPVALTRMLGLQEAPGLTAINLLANYLRPRRLLLVLDNCEHLILAGAQLAGGLLSACPRLTILATSREPLGIGGEAVWPVPPMQVPGRGSPDSPSALIEIVWYLLF